MKYWLLSTEYPPQFGGGIGTYCFQWCQQLREKGIEVTVFLINKDVKTFQISIIDEVRVVEFSPYYEDTSPFLGYETMISYSYEKIVSEFILKEGCPDWLESQEYNGIAYYILQKRELGFEVYKDLRVVLNCHCPSYVAFEFNHVSTYQLPYFWIGEMERFCLKAADICISPSQYLVDILLERHPALQREFHILKNPYRVLDLPKPTLSSSEKEIVFLGKLSPIKGILTALKALAILWDKGYNYKLNLIGDEYYYYHAIGGFMKNHIVEKYGRYIERGLLKMSGAMSPDKVNEALNQAAVVLIPSAFDNFPYTVLEVMASKKLIVASDSGGHKEIIRHGANGFLFKSGSETDLVDKIQQALSLSLSEANTVTEAARKDVKNSCDPDLYYQRKFKTLNAYLPRFSKDIFPFLNPASTNNSSSTTVNGNNGLLSVVIPYYNMGNYVEETIESIKGSDYNNVEIILINDGSSDQLSISKLSKWKDDKMIRIIHQENKGLATARNNAAQVAKGEFLAFLDADDKISVNYYTRAINILQQKRNIHFVGCWTKYFDGSENIWPAFTPEPPYILYHNMVNSSSVVYRRESFLAKGINDPKFIYGMEDYDAIISLVQSGLGGVVIPEIHFLYRVRKGSMARSFNKSNMTYTYELIAKKYSSFYATFAAEITGLLNSNGPGYKCENPTLDDHLYPEKSIQKIFIKKLLSQIKRNPQLRKIAISVYRRIKFNIL